MPYHHALPVHNLEAAKNFYGNILGCTEGILLNFDILIGRSSTKW
jgi:extradiol dioxygenase family protein